MIASMTSRQKLTPRFPFPPGSGITGWAARITTRWIRKQATRTRRYSPASSPTPGPAGILSGAQCGSWPARRESGSSLTSEPACPATTAPTRSPGARVVYADNDPLVLAHARALLTSSTPGTTDYISGDLNNPAGILEIARQKLDFSRPVAIMLMGVLGNVGNPAENDDHFAWSVVRELTSALPSGGYLALHDTADIDPAHNAALEYYNKTGAIPYHARRTDQITRWFDGLELVDPGAVPIHEWRPDPSPFPQTPVPSIGGVGRKPS